jgi:hypothetical protein
MSPATWFACAGAAVADLRSAALSLSCARRDGDNPSFEWKWKQVEPPWAAGLSYIIATQRCNGQLGLEVYPVQFTVTQRSSALKDLSPTALFGLTTTWQ